MLKFFKNSAFSVYLIAFVLSSCSLVYELLIAQTIASLATNTVIWYSLTIGFYLGAMGIGALLCHKIYHKKSGWEALFEVEVVLSMIGAMAVGVIYFAHMIMTFLWVRHAFFQGVTVFFLFSLFMVLAVGFFTGLELPLLIRVGNEARQGQKITNRILGADYFGALVGGIFFPLVLLPYCGLLMAGFGVALLNLTVAGSIAFLFFSKKNPVMTAQREKPVTYSRSFSVSPTHALSRETSAMSCSKKIIFCILGCMIILGIFYVGPIQQYFLKKYYYYEVASQNFKTFLMPDFDAPRIERYHSLYQDIDIVKVPKNGKPFSLLLNAYSKKFQNEPDFPRDQALFLNGSFQFWTNFEEVYHEYFAHVPIIFNQHVPKKVLVLGAGDGLLLRELIKYSDIQEITQVELDKKMIYLAKTHPMLRRLNKNVLKDPRIQIIFGDAYHYLRKSKEKFDAIYLDFPEPDDYRLSKLYSQEFFHFVYQHLTEDGFAVLDAPYIGLNKARGKLGQLDNNGEIYRATLKAAGFNKIINYASQLEVDNVKARAIFDEAIGNINEITVTEISIGGTYKKRIVGREAVITRLIEDFVGDYKQRFFMVKKKGKKRRPIYKNFRIPMYVLNEKRFYLAFTKDFLEEGDSKKINSIMRPTLPDPSVWWRLKMPY